MARVAEAERAPDDAGRQPERRSREQNTTAVAARRVRPWALPVLVLGVVVALFVVGSTTVGFAALGGVFVVTLVVTGGWSKLGHLAAVLLVVTFFAAMLIRLLPGDPAVAIVPGGSPQQRQQLREEIGLDDAFYVQYGRFVGDLAQGDLGRYYQSGGAGQPVSERLGDALPVTLQLVLYVQLVALLIAVPLGILAAYKAGTAFDKIANAAMFALVALPSFVLAYFLLYFLAVQRDIFPVVGYTPFGENVGEHFRSMFLPTVSLAAGQAAIYMRLLRSDMIQTLQEDYITMARSKGLSTTRILVRHALRPSSFSFLTVAAINVGTLIGGAVVIETIFNLPGMGVLIFEAIRERQYVALQALVAVIGIGYVAVNAAVDQLYHLLDPRIRGARSNT